MNLQHFRYSAVIKLPQYCTVALENHVTGKTFKLLPNYSGALCTRSRSPVIPGVADDILTS